MRLMTRPLVPAALIAVVACGGPTVDAEAVDFVRDVRPIFQRHCYACHGAKKQKSGLRLDVKSAAREGGELYGASVVAGDAGGSPLIQFVADPDADLRMPPKRSRLSPREIAVLTGWVEQGAVWPDGVDLVELEDPRDHWSFQPIKRTEGPETKNQQWPRNAIDRFILARLESVNLAPACEVDRADWLRRATLDLTGLPPSPAETAAFVEDPRSDAYERAVDRLLASPRYGERWAQHWLDVVRYADTDGFEVNTPRPNAWPYRDYVIEALNNDTPYDEFIREQLAGDAYGRDAATGFLVTAAALLPGQIGQDDASKRLARQDELAEIVTNVSDTFLGLTVGCARCHDHKFDPIRAHDYYAMQAFFAGVEYGERPHNDESTEGMIFAGKFKAPETTHLLLRGDPEQPQDEVQPAAPAFFGDLQLPQGASDRERRQALADWIARPDNPLTARVMVNRIWQGHFGIGLVETANDFGHSGAKPSHPELLDWLASQFIRSNWSIKHMHRLIVLSATYRQSRQLTAGGTAIDGDVRLLWRFPTRRLEAEAIRDSMLAVSGRLNLKTGGPGFDLFKSRGGLNGFPPIESFEGDGLRRMIYAHKIRMEREAVFGAFDCPDAGQSAPGRRQSTTPVQALNLLNSQFTIDESAAFARRLESEAGPEIRRQVRRAYQHAMTRDPDPEELRDAAEVVREHGLPTLCRALFNCNEFLFLP